MNSSLPEASKSLTCELTIEKLIEGGNGLAHIERGSGLAGPSAGAGGIGALDENPGKGARAPSYDKHGQVVFVPWTLPGERVEITLTDLGKGYFRGEPVRILSPSPKRVIPPCPLYQRCGGCQLQHLDPSDQADEKAAIFRETLVRIGGIDPSRILPIIPSPRPFHYRNRCQLKVRYHNGQNLIGFYESQSHRLVPVEECLLLEPLLNETLRSLSDFLKGDRAIPTLRKVQIYLSPSQQNLLLSLHTVEPLPYPLEGLYEQLHSSLPLAGIVAYSSTTGRQQIGEDHLFYQLGNLTLRVSDRSFAQTNWSLNETLVEILLKSARPLQGKRILELYAGMGNFSLPLTQEGAELSGLDENPYAIQDAIQNATHNKISGCRFQIADLNLGIKKYITPRETVDLFLLDPPREGLPKHLLREMIALSPPWILYISCSPPTLARDLKQLTRQGYALNSIQPIDLFPQTAHMEAIAELNYKG